MLSITWCMPEWVQNMQRQPIQDEKNSEFFRKLSQMNDDAKKRALTSEPLNIDGVFKMPE